MEDIKITWKIVDMNVYNDGDLQNIIHSIKWVCIAEKGDKKEESVGSAVLPYPSEENFQSITSVTKELAEEWLMNSFGEEGKQQIENSLVERINLVPQVTEKPFWLTE